MRKCCHRDSLSRVSELVLRHIFNFLCLPSSLLSLAVTVKMEGDISTPSSSCYRLCILRKSQSHLISHRVFEAEPAKLGVEFSSLLPFSGWKIFVNELSLCKGNLEQFYHIKQSIVFVLFHLFNFAYSRSVGGALLSMNFNLIFLFSFLPTNE